MKHNVSRDILHPILRSGKKLDSFNFNTSHVTPKKSIKVLCQRKQVENSPDAAPTTSRINLSGVKDEVNKSEIQQTAIKLKFESKIEHSRIISDDTLNKSESPRKFESFKNSSYHTNETYQSRNKIHDKENSLDQMSPSKVIQQYGLKLQIKEVSNPFIDQQTEKRKQSAERFKQSKIYTKKTNEMQKKCAKNKIKEIQNPEIILKKSNQTILKLKTCPKDEFEQENLSKQDQHMISFTFGDEDQHCDSPDNALKMLMRSTQQQKLKQFAKVQEMIAFQIQYQNQIEQLESSPAKSPLKEEINVENKLDQQESNIQQEQDIDLKSYIQNENTSNFNEEKSAHVESITYSEIQRQADNLQRQNLQIEKRLSFLQLPRVPSFDSFEIDSSLYGKALQLNSSLLQQKRSENADEDSLCDNQENIDILQQSDSHFVDQTENDNTVVPTEQIQDQEANQQKSRRKSRKQREQSRPKTQAHFLKICDEEQQEAVIEEEITPLTNPSKKNQVQSCTFEEQLFYEQQIQQMQAELSLLGRQENELFIEVKEEINNQQDEEELVEDSEHEKVEKIMPENLQQISITTVDQPKFEMPIPAQQTQFLFSIGQGLFESQKDFERERESQSNSVLESPCQQKYNQIDEVEVEIVEKEVEVDTVSQTNSNNQDKSSVEEKQRFLTIKEKIGSEQVTYKNQIQKVQQLQADFQDINSSTSIMSNLVASQHNSPPTKKGSFIINKFSIKNLINRVEENGEVEEKNLSEARVENQLMYKASPLIQLAIIPSSEEPQQIQIEFFDQIQDNCGYRFQLNPIVSGRAENEITAQINQNFDLQSNMSQIYNDNFTGTQTFVPLIQLNQVNQDHLKNLEPYNDDGSQTDQNITSRLSNSSFTGKERRSRKNRSQSGGKTKIKINIKEMKSEINQKNQEIKLTETTIFQPGFIQQKNNKADEPQSLGYDVQIFQDLVEQYRIENPSELQEAEPNIIEISPKTSKSTEGSNRLSLFKKSQKLTLPEQNIQESRTPIMINTSQAQSPLIFLQQMMQMQKKNGQQNYSEVSFQERALLKQECEEEEQQYKPIETVQCQEDQIVNLTYQESPEKIIAKSVKKEDRGREYFSVLSDPGSSMLSTQMLKQQEEPPVSPSVIQNSAYPTPSPFHMTAQRRKSPQQTSNIKNRSQKKQSTVKKTAFNKTQQISNNTGVKIQDSWVKQISEFLSVPHHFGLDLTQQVQSSIDDKSENSCLNNLIITTTDRRKNTIAKAEAVLAKTTVIEKYEINKSQTSVSQDFSMTDFKMFDTQNKSIESHENPHHFSRQSVGQSKSQNQKNDYLEGIDSSQDVLICAPSYLARHGKNEARIRLHEQSYKQEQSVEKNPLDQMYQDCVLQPKTEVQCLGDDGQVRLRLQPTINVIDNIQQMNRVTQQVKDKIKSKYSIPTVKNLPAASTRTTAVKSAQKIRNQKILCTQQLENLQSNPSSRFKTKIENSAKVTDSRFSFGDQSALYQITNRSDMPQLHLQQPIQQEPKVQKGFGLNSIRSTQSKDSKLSDNLKPTDMPYAFKTIDQPYIYKTKISQTVGTLQSSYSVLKKPAVKPKPKLDQSIDMLKSRMSETNTSIISSAKFSQKKQTKLGDWK